MTKFRIVGSSDFNALVIFSPLRIEVDWKLDVAIFIGKNDNEFCGATLFAEVQGPQPWFASGYAEFRFVGAKVRFPLEVGARQQPDPVPEIDVLTDVLIPALSDPDAWRGEAIDETGVVRLREGIDLQKTVLPNAGIRISQTAVPLSQRIEKVGRARAKGGPQWCRIASAGIGERRLKIDASDDVTEEFAPAQFFEFTESERLASPSFERYVSGISFGADADQHSADAIAAPSGFEEGFVDPMYDETAATRRKRPLRDLPDQPEAVAAAPVVQVLRPEYAVVVEGETVGTAARYADALHLSRSHTGRARIVAGGA